MSELMIAANTTAPKSENAAPKAEKPATAAPKAEKPATAAPKSDNAAPKTDKPAAPGNAKIEVPDKPRKVEENKKEAGSPWLSMLPFILIFVVMIFFMNRSQKKQMAKRQEMMDKIAKGTKVLLTSGIYGTVDAVHDDFMIVEIASGVKIKVAKNGISGIDAPEESGKKAEGKKAEGKKTEDK